MIKNAKGLYKKSADDQVYGDKRQCLKNFFVSRHAWILIMLNTFHTFSFRKKMQILKSVLNNYLDTKQFYK